MPTFITEKTLYDVHRHAVGAQTPAEFFECYSLPQFVRDAEFFSAPGWTPTPSQMALEYQHVKALYAAGRPYYKVWPDYLPAMSRTQLNIPASVFALPFACWEIRLPAGLVAWPMPFDSARPVSASITDRSVTTIRVSDVSAAIMDGTEDSLQQTMQQAIDVYGGGNSRVIELRVSCGVGGAFQAFLLILGDAIPTIEAGVRSAFESARYAGGHAGWEQISRIVVTVTGLITGNDNIIEPDVLNKDIPKLQAAKTPEELTKLQDKASRVQKTGKGWTIGRRERLLKICRDRNNEETDASGRKLEFSHQRCGHFHHYHTKAGMIMRWIPQLTVKPELPPNPAGRAGVKIAN